MMCRAIYLTTLIALLAAKVAAQDARDRLGTYYSQIPLYRTNQGTNVVSVGFGTPEQLRNLTFSTNVPYIMVATDQCAGCTSGSNTFDIGETSSLTPSTQGLTYTLSSPGITGEAADLLTLDAIYGSEKIFDPRGDTDRSRTVAFITDVEGNVQLPTGSSGYFGIGVDQATPDRSLIPNFIVDAGGAIQANKYHVVGMEVNRYSRDRSVPAGEIHWGAAPDGKFNGEFNWINVDKTKAGGWAFGIDAFRLGSHVVQGTDLFASLDPGYDTLVVPSSIAESVYSTIPEATRDTRTPARWNLPCNYNMSLVVSINSRSYNVEASQLVQPRDFAGRTCWGAVMAWTEGSVPDVSGEVRLGTPFMQGVYSALYYSATQQQVGIAGKPDSVNDFVARSEGGSRVDGRIAGAVIGSILGVLLILFLVCYSRNHNTFQSFYYRAIRRQQQAQVNAAFLHATLPPPPMMAGPMGMPMGMPAMGMPAMGMPPMGMPGMMPPPMYHSPMGPMGPPMGPPIGMGMPPLMPPVMRGAYMHPGAMHLGGMPPPRNGFFNNMFRRPDFIQPRHHVPPRWNDSPEQQDGKVRFGEVQAYDPPTPYSSRGYSSEEARQQPQLHYDHHSQPTYEQPSQEPGPARYHPEGRPPPADWVPPVPEHGRPLGMPHHHHEKQGMGEKRRSRGFWRSGRSDGANSPVTPRPAREGVWRGLMRKRDEAAAERQGLQVDHGYV